MSILSIALLATLAVGAPSVSGPSVSGPPVGAPSVVESSIDTVRPMVPVDTIPRTDSDLTSPTLPIDSTLRRAMAQLDSLQDTIPRRRAAVTYSDAYGTRATIHRRLSYTMLPLFAASYFTGDRLFKDGPEAPAWVRNTHRVSATSVAVLFGANTITGGWNLWEARHDPNDRKRRLVHSALFMAATAGFAYSGAVLAEQAERSAEKRRQHRTVNLISMGLSTGSVAVMLFGRD